MSGPVYCPYCLGKTVQRTGNRANSWLECTSCGAWYTIWSLNRTNHTTVKDREEACDDIVGTLQEVQG